MELDFVKAFFYRDDSSGLCIVKEGHFFYAPVSRYTNSGAI
jgi:hypothetical protein